MILRGAAGHRFYQPVCCALACLPALRAPRVGNYQPDDMTSYSPVGTLYQYDVTSYLVAIGW